MSIHYTPESVNDLNRLREFISEKNPYAAQRIAGELLEGINKLMVFPKMGIPVSRAPAPSMVRDLFVGSYTVRYLLAGDKIYILRLWHNKEIERG
jgi:plasmid stabilization system protein ParE